MKEKDSQVGQVSTLRNQYEKLEVDYRDAVRELQSEKNMRLKYPLVILFVYAFRSVYMVKQGKPWLTKLSNPSKASM